MNRNKFILQISLAVFLILIAAFAGQIRKVQRNWRSAVRIMPGASEPGVVFDPNQVDETRNSAPEVLVKFRPGVSEEAIAEITSRLNDRVEDEIESVSGLAAIDDLDNLEAESIAAVYRVLPEVEYAEPSYEIRLKHDDGGFKHVHPNDARFSEQWALDNHAQNGGKEGADIGALRAWVTTTGDDDIVVAVLDSGVDYNHSDLQNNIWVRPDSINQYEDRDLGSIEDVHGYNAVDNTGDPMDENGHGTHCAGIIGAEGGNEIGISGVNWKVKIMPLKFMNASGFGTTKDAIEAINYVIDRKRDGVNVRVISASWGSKMRSQALEDVIRKAQEAGILFVAASGNDSANTDQFPQYPAGYNLGNVISVAALNRQDELAPFSNYGARSVHIAAPGANILSTWLGNEYEEHSGTSMATPIVSGVAALVLSKQPDLSVDELRSVLLKSVDKLPQLSGKVSTGGRISAAKAVGA
ncbi:MAG: S8 family serine peptidase, partial [Pyrinomonadaceae bacterium]|nr:S8 family serine peptidase [Pyrinomonadaceae bacterium]